MILDRLAWPDLGGAAGKICTIPLGATEQHGPHLPLWTDTAIVAAIAERVEARLPGHVALAPAQPVGYSPHHARFGCLSLDLASYIGTISSLCRSAAAMGFRRVFLLNGHGGNDAPGRAALCGLKAEQPDLRIALASYWSLAAEEFARIRTSPRGGMGHACEMETSVMLALHPQEVRRDRIRDEGTAGETGFGLLDMLRPQPYYMVRNFDELTGSGTLGMPSQASAEKGERFLEAAVEAVCRFVAAFDRGELEGRAGAS